MGTLYAKREPDAPYFWVVRDQLGNKIARDQYSNDLRDRFCRPRFNLVFEEDE